METTHDGVSSTMLECDDDKLTNRISTTNAPQLKDTESACTRHGPQRLFENKDDDDMNQIEPKPKQVQLRIIEKKIN